MITTHSIMGPRLANEDKFLGRETAFGVLLAVMDGHGGVDVAKLTKAILPEVWDRHQFHPGTLTEVMQLVFAELVNRTAIYNGCGSTASIVFLPKANDFAVVGVMGDSPVIIGTSPTGVWLGPDHNVRTNPAEADAALARGGIVAGGYLWTDYSDLGDGIQMTRALGDAAFERVMNKSPEISRVPVDDFILVASDGLSDPSHKISLADNARLMAALIRKKNFNAEQLVKGVLKPRDNVTAVLWRR